MQNLREVAKEVFDKHGSTEVGINHLVSKMSCSRDLTDQALPIAADQLLRQLQSQLRESLKYNAYTVRSDNGKRYGPPKKYDSSLDAKVDELCTNLLMDWPMRNGSKIGDAVRPDLVAEAQFYGKLRKANGDNENWIKSIASKLKDDVTPVRNVLTEQQMQAIRKKIWVEKLASI